MRELAGWSVEEGETRAREGKREILSKKKERRNTRKDRQQPSDRDQRPLQYFGGVRAGAQKEEARGRG